MASRNKASAAVETKARATRRRWWPAGRPTGVSRESAAMAETHTGPLGEASTPPEEARCGRGNLPPDCGCWGATQAAGLTDGGLSMPKGAGTCARAALTDPLVVDVGDNCLVI